MSTDLMDTVFNFAVVLAILVIGLLGVGVFELGRLSVFYQWHMPHMVW